MSVTFHKAIDDARDPFAALDALAELGVERVLTSGQAPTAVLGAARLAEIVRHAQGRIVVMAGGTIREADLPVLAAAGLDEIHSGSSVDQDGATDRGRVASLVAAWTSAHSAARCD
jgi:copper homeostasis protein